MVPGLRLLLRTFRTARLLARPGHQTPLCPRESRAAGWRLRGLRASMAVQERSLSSQAGSKELGKEVEAEGEAGGGEDPVPEGSQLLQQSDGCQMVGRKKKQRKKQRKEPHCLDNSINCLMMEMPFATADSEFSSSSTSKPNVKEKRKRTIGREIEEENDTIIQKDHRLSNAMICYGSFHVTLLVMHLSSEGAIDKAVGAFLESKDLIEELLQGKPLDLTFQGTDHFRNQVGFVKLTESDHTTTLLKIAEQSVKQLEPNKLTQSLFICLYLDIVKKVFQENGIFTTDDRAFKPHMTFMKLSKSPKLRKQVQ
ncbi:hypothetical protein lerEdw1_018002 [Lerista edwardsae]|nr:hypothetical protein lerEdw1_018002 [Lerista edwardsae]